MSDDEDVPTVGAGEQEKEEEVTDLSNRWDWTDNRLRRLCSAQVSAPLHKFFSTIFFSLSVGTNN